MAARTSPLQNRVTPFGEIIATPERGLLFGNRGGCFHVEGGALTKKRWVSDHWIACVLQYTSKTPPYREHHHDLTAPNIYTGLFFLDEATAFAAGHRPCFYCRSREAKTFLAGWLAANADAVPAGTRLIGPVDAVLQRERVRRDRSKVTYEADVATLPDGTFIERDGHAWLVWRRGLLRWDPGGYVSRLPKPTGGVVTVLTPRSVVRLFASGFVPGVHPSVG
jgi:hypothetical protein